MTTHRLFLADALSRQAKITHKQANLCQATAGAQFELAQSAFEGLLLDTGDKIMTDADHKQALGYLLENQALIMEGLANLLQRPQ